GPERRPRMRSGAWREQAQSPASRRSRCPHLASRSTRNLFEINRHCCWLEFPKSSLATTAVGEEWSYQVAQQLARSAGLGAPRAQPPELLGHAREQFHYLDCRIGAAIALG